MKVKEITESLADLKHPGMGEQPQDHYLLELPTETHLLGKLEQSGQVVRIVKRVDHVKFSDKPNWILIDLDLTEKGKKFKWLPGDTRFTWVREFSREEIENENIGDSIGMRDVGGQWASTGARNHQM